MAYEAHALHWAQIVADSTGVKVKDLAREGLNLVTIMLPSGSRLPSVPPFTSQLPRDREMLPTAGRLLAAKGCRTTGCGRVCGAV